MKLSPRLIVAFLALVAGAAAAVAHPPFGFLPGILGYGLLFWLVDDRDAEKPWWRAFGIGWLAGFAYFLVGCWWVAEAFLVDAEAHAWMAPFAATLLPAGLGIFWGLACVIYRRIAPVRLPRVLVFAAVFSTFEWLRGHILTGFPWNLPGETWAAGSAPSQWAAWVGVYGLTFLTVLAATAFAPLMQDGAFKRRCGAAVGGLLILAAFYVGGAYRLAATRVEAGGTTVRVVQADVEQQAKWSPENYRAIVQRYLVLTQRPAFRRPDVVIWPEGALPAPAHEIFAPESFTAEGLKAAVQPGQTLLMGAYRAEPAGNDVRYFNSLFALQADRAGVLRVAGVYDKHRLVPFGEYLPLEDLMTRLGAKELARIGDGFTPGPRPRPMSLPGVPRVQPLICYEGLFPGLAEPAGRRPTWLVNVSNDAWFGKTSGPLQHLNLASYRAIEQGLPMVRSTPTGVSAVIDPLGRVLPKARLNPGESGVIDARLPKALNPTLYSQVGDLVFWLLVILGLACAISPKRWIRRPHA